MALDFSGLNRLLDVLQSYGIKDVALPFLLIFTIIFAVLQRVKVFGDDKKNIHMVLALLFSLLSVIPHITGDYSRFGFDYDPVNIINALIPSAAVLSIAIILILFLFGIFGSKFTDKGTPGIAIILILVVLGYIFGATVGWWSAPGDVFGSWWDSDLTTLMIVILVFGAIVFWITGEKDDHSFMKNAMDFLTGWHK